MNRQRMNNPNKKYKELKQKQKARISDLMYRETDRFLQEKKQPPDDNEVVQIAERVYCRIQGRGFWIPYGEVLNEYQKKMSTYSPATTRIRFATALASQNEKRTIC